MRRAIPSLLWLTAMYTATAFSEAAPPLRLIEWQRIARQRVYAAASLFDVGVDTLGAWLGLLIVRRLRKTPPASPRPLTATNRPRSESNEVTEPSESRSSPA